MAFDRDPLTRGIAVMVLVAGALLLSSYYLHRMSLPAAPSRPREQPHNGYATGFATEPGGRSQSVSGRSVRGRLEWAGLQFAELEAGEPRFWFRDETQMIEAGLQVDYEPGMSSFRIRDVEDGIYGISVYVGHITNNPESAYRAWVEFTVPLTTGVPEIVVPLTRAIHLRAPVDNEVAGDQHGLNIHRSPVEFRWDAVQRADRYQVRVQRQPQLVEAANSPQTFFAGDMTRTSFKLDLDEGWIYTLYIDAYRERELIARIWGSGDSWAGMSYRFMIGESQLEAID